MPYRNEVGKWFLQSRVRLELLSFSKDISDADGEDAKVTMFNVFIWVICKELGS